MQVTLETLNHLILTNYTSLIFNLGNEKTSSVNLKCLQKFTELVRNGAQMYHS